MSYCSKCGAQMEEGKKFCGSCGAAVDAGATPQTAQQPDFGAKIAELNNTADTTGEYDAKDITDNKPLAILAYLGILWLIPFFVKKDSKFVQYHCKQGFTLLLLGVVYSIFSTVVSTVIKFPHYIYGVYYGSYTPGWLSTILWLISIPIFILVIMGIVNAASGKAKELPIIGKIKILK